MKLLHFADLHLGRQFSDYPEVKDTLSNARYETLENLVRIATEEKCDLITIGGDLFDKLTIKVSDIVRTVQTLNKFQNGPVLVMPGNHDFITSDSKLWDRFKKETEDHVLVLDEMKPVSLEDFDLPVTVYPAPCNAKHSSQNHIGWITEEVKPEGHITLGIAHGSIEGVSPDFADQYYPMNPSQLNDCGVDVWLMGHTHITWPENPDANDRILMPGTPEPDGMKCRHEGNAFIVEFDDQKKFSVKAISTGKYEFRNLILDVQSINQLKTIFVNQSHTNIENTVCKLKIRGRVDAEAYEKWHDEWLPKLRSAALFLNYDGTEFHKKVTKEEIAQTYSEGSFPAEILNHFVDSEDDLALQMSYDILKEATK